MQQQALLTPDSCTLPPVPIPLSRPWIPDSIRDRVRAGEVVRHGARLSRAERRVWRKRPRILISEWAPRHRWVRVSSREGQWSNATTPYLAGVMDGIGFPSVRDVTICATPQSGKTEAVYNCLGYFADRDPGPALVVFADEQTAKDEKDERLDPMFRDSPRLRQYLTKAQRDVTTLRLSLTHMVVHMAWATSVARLATKPKRYVIFDEVDKYPESLKRETDPINLGIKRTRTYPDDRKVIKLSTPTVESGPVWKSLSEAQAVFHYQVKCPHCWHMQQMQFGERDSRGGIKWPTDVRDAARIETERLAWYVCPHCSSRWDDADRDKAVRLGCWIEAGSGRELMHVLQASRPSRIGFHIPAWLSTFVSLSECAGAFLRAQGSKSYLKDFMNAIKAEPWIEYEVEREEDQVLALCDERPRGLVPEEADVLLAGIDTQDNGFWYEIRAFQRGRLLESWQVREGFVPASWAKVDPAELQGRAWRYHPAFDPLREILFETEYQTADGRSLSVQAAGMDAMGHHTTEVYDFCRSHRRVKPIQGMPNRGNRPNKWTKIDTYPGSSKPIPGGVQLLQLDVNYWKDELSDKLQIQPLDPGAWHLHSETTRDWAAQMCAEYLDDTKGRWVCPEHKANHAWDVSVYVLALAVVLGGKFAARQGEEVRGQRSEVRKKEEERVNPYTHGKNPFGRQR